MGRNFIVGCCWEADNRRGEAERHVDLCTLVEGHLDAHRGSHLVDHVNAFVRSEHDHRWNNPPPGASMFGHSLS